MDTTSPAPAPVARAERQPEVIALGHACNTHRNYIGAIEHGEINPTFRVLLRLSRGLDLPLTEIVEVYERHLAP